MIPPYLGLHSSILFKPHYLCSVLLVISKSFHTTNISKQTFSCSITIPLFMSKRLPHKRKHFNYPIPDEYVFSHALAINTIT